MARIELLTGEAPQADSPVLDLMPFHQMRAQAFFGMRPQLFHDIAGIAVMEVVRPPAEGGVHTADNIVQRNGCALPCSQLLDARLDFRKRFRRRTDLRITLARLPTLAHPDFKPQEGEAGLPCIDDVGLVLVEREFKTVQHVPYYCQRRVRFTFAQHHEIVRVAHDSCPQLSVQPMPIPYPVQ